MTYYTFLDSPIGQLLLTSDGENITRLFMEDFEGGPTAIAGFADSSSRRGFASVRMESWQPGDGDQVLKEAARQIEEYFAGKRQGFDLPLKPEGTGFQQTVWNELTRIPFGHTITYGELARRIGNPDAPRAVGLANGKNPISIIVPCHRVIGASGTLTGYGGGLDRKKWLLEHEGVALGANQAVLAI